MESIQTPSKPRGELEKQFIGVLIPCYNEERRIAAVIVECQRFASSIYVCDDGSNDLTAQIATKLGAKVLRHKFNLGYGAALRTLFDTAADAGQLKVVVTFDGDGQHDPEDIARVAKPILDDEADVVIGSRFSGGEKSNDNVPGYRKVGIKVITGLTNKISSLGVTDSQSGLRAYDARLLRKLMPSEAGMSASTEILMKASQMSLRIEEIPVDIKYDGESSTHNPILHGGGVIMGLIKQWSLRHTLLFYGVPGFASLLISLFFWGVVVEYFSATKLLETNYAIVAVAFTVIGIMLMTTAMILWTIINVVRSGQRYDS